MKTKILSLSVLLSIGTITATAQVSDKLRFGATAGLNVANFTQSSNFKMDARLGFHLGVRAEYNLTNSLYASSGLLFSLKGAKFSEGTEKEKHNPYYLEIPVQIGYRHGLNDRLDIFGETGPYFGIGIGGKSTYEDSEYNDNTSVSFFGKDDEDGMEANRYDFGWAFRLGVELDKKYQISMGYEIGITPNVDWELDEWRPKNSNFMVSFSYMF